MQRDQTTIIDIYNIINLIIDFTQGMTQNEFREDVKTQAAVLYEIALLGEAGRRFSTEFRIKHPEIPYSEIIAMRNKLIHDYQEVDLGIVWQTIQQDIPQLFEIISLLLSQESSSENLQV
jgi:uncharacterized protein with HEPN domain